MNNIQVHSILEKRKAAGAEVNEQFGIVLLYDAEEALEAARHIIDRIIGKHFAHPDLHQDELSFAEVMHPELRAESIQLASRCDILIVATIDGSHLQGAVASWIELWFESRPQKECAIISIAGSPAGSVESTAMQDYLHHLADRYGLAFFASSFELPESEKATQVSEKLEATERVPHNVKPRPERWGLNE